MSPTLNGITLRIDEPLKDQRKSTFNMMLGKDGRPKYSTAQLEEMTRLQLLQEVLPIYNAALQGNPHEPKEYKKRGAKRRPSKSRHNALSKKCHVIKELCEGTSTLEDALIWLGDDYWFSQVCTKEELVHAFETKERPRSKNKRKVDGLKTHEDMLDDGYILAKGDGE